MERFAPVWFASTEALCLAATLFARQFFKSIPDAVTDIYMLAVIWVTYKCSWKWGLMALALSLPMALYLLDPIDGRDLLTVASLAVSGIILVGILRAASFSSRT